MGKNREYSGVQKESEQTREQQGFEGESIGGQRAPVRAFDFVFDLVRALRLFRRRLLSLQYLVPLQRHLCFRYAAATGREGHEWLIYIKHALYHGGIH